MHLPLLHFYAVAARELGRACCGSRERLDPVNNTVLAEADGELNGDGGALLTLKPDAAVVKRLELRRGTIPATVLAVSGGSQDSKRVTLTVQGLTKPKPKAHSRR